MWSIFGATDQGKERTRMESAEYFLEELVHIMVTHDMQKVTAEHVANVMRTNLAEYLEKGIVK